MKEIRDLPVVDGFRQRGLATTRLETFTDAAFAFALTLLVISFDSIPASYAEFIEALKRIPVFAASFAQISVFWYAHHEWSRRFGLDDLPTALISLLLVFTTLVYVYPLRIIFSAFFHWMSQGWLPFELGHMSQDQLGELFAIYGAGFVAMSLCIMWLYRHALKQSDALELSAGEVFRSKWAQQSFAVYLWTGVLSIVLGLALPNHLGGFAGFAYASLALTMPGFQIWKYRQARSLGHLD